MPTQSIDLSAVKDITFNGTAVDAVNLNGAEIWSGSNKPFLLKVRIPIPSKRQAYTINQPHYTVTTAEPYVSGSSIGQYYAFWDVEGGPLLTLPACSLSANLKLITTPDDPRPLLIDSQILMSQTMADNAVGDVVGEGINNSPTGAPHIAHTTTGWGDIQEPSMQTASDFATRVATIYNESSQVTSGPRYYTTGTAPTSLSVLYVRAISAYNPHFYIQADHYGGGPLGNHMTWSEGVFTALKSPPYITGAAVTGTKLAYVEPDGSLDVIDMVDIRRGPYVATNTDGYGVTTPAHYNVTYRGWVAPGHFTHSSYCRFYEVADPTLPGSGQPPVMTRAALATAIANGTMPTGLVTQEFVVQGDTIVQRTHVHLGCSTGQYQYTVTDTPVTAVNPATGEAYLGLINDY